MRAIRIEQYGGPEVLLDVEMPVPEPGPGEVLVRLNYAGINFMDVHTRQGKYANSHTYPVRLPCTIGMEGAATVVRTGPGVGEFIPGDRVAWCIHWGSYAEFACVPAWRLVKVPDALSLESAAAITFHGLTAHYLVNDVGHLGPGVTCFIHAASGGIGQLLVQLARRAGARVLAGASSAEKAAVVRARGAHEVLVYRDGDFAARVRELTDGRGVDVIFDAIGKDTLRDSFRATRRSGLVVNYGSVSGSLRDLDPIELGEAGSLFLTRPRLADHLADAPTIRGRAADIYEAVLSGQLVMQIAGRYTLDNFAEAHAALEERRILGKPILVIAEEPR